MKKILRTVTVPQSIDFFKEVIQTMAKDGHEIVVVTSPGVELEQFREECPQFKVIELPMERHISLWKDGIALLRMIWVLLKERPYIVHSMTPKAGLLTMVAGWITRVPVRIHTFTGLVWPTAVGTKRKVLMLTDKILCACATHVIPEGQGVLDDLKNNGVCKKPMKVLGYGNVKGVDMDVFNPVRFKKEREDADGFVYLFVGRIVGDKGINELVAAFVRLNEKHPETRLWLVGAYEDKLDPVTATTRKLIDTCEAIEYLGPKYADDLRQMYVEADCFVMPSYREGFPNTVLEAGAMGLPSVVTDINGSREIIMDGVNGLIVPSKDAEALYSAMERIFTDNKFREEMASNSRPLIYSRFEKSFVQGCQIEFYNEIIRRAEA